MSDLIRREDVLSELDGWFYDPQADKLTDTRMQDTIRALPADTVQAQIDEVQPDLLEEACIAAHNAYEQAAHEAGWITNLQSRKPWADVPEANKIAMRAGIAAAIALIRKGDQP
jgi:hypothetical protein